MPRFRHLPTPAHRDTRYRIEVFERLPEKNTYRFRAYDGQYCVYTHQFLPAIAAGRTPEQLTELFIKATEREVEAAAIA
ncbi:hypothetical protein [Carnimonas nigrificans]|uniref:hypothetical protein n=1 Tax=Carnimonas nigrificans TaxID=64323 RepID=UPI00046EC2AA|nr:hypothetical protein [Carnimonas nigrificans]